MSIQDWAKREVEIAYTRERKASGVDKDGDFDYGCACYESALKAYQSLMDDDHSGFSIGLTKDILNRLLEGKPLTPIEDTDDDWNDISDMSGLHGEEFNYQCKRMSSLFKYVYSDGSVKYKDVDNNRFININEPNICWYNGLVQRTIDEMFPITMPYYPGSRYEVYGEEFLIDEKNGDYDTVGLLYAMKDGEKIDINRFFKEVDRQWVEIDSLEYEERKTSNNTISEYDYYLKHHKSNVKKGFDWLWENIPELFKRGNIYEYGNITNHDASKTNKDEYDAYKEYFYGGNKSYEVIKNFDVAWLKHIHRNPHHWQYWVLISDEVEEGIKVLDMPYDYIIEMICDWWSFSWKTNDLYSIFKWYDDHKNIKLSTKTRNIVNDILSKIRSKLVELNIENVNGY